MTTCETTQATEQLSEERLQSLEVSARELSTSTGKLTLATGDVLVLVGELRAQRAARQAPVPEDVALDAAELEGLLVARCEVGAELARSQTLPSRLATAAERVPGLEARLREWGTENTGLLLRVSAADSERDAARQEAAEARAMEEQYMRERDRLQDEERALRSQEATLTARVSSDGEKLLGLQQQASTLAQEVNALRSQVATLEAEKAERKAGLETMQRITREAVDRAEALEVDAGALRSEVTKRRTHEAELMQRVATLEDARAALRQEVRDVAAMQPVMAQEFIDERARVESLEVEAGALRSEVAKRRSHVAELERERDSLRLAQNMTKTRAEKAEAGEAKAEARATAAERKVAEYEEALMQVGEALGLSSVTGPTVVQAVKDAKAAERRVAELEAHVKRIRAHREVVEGLPEGTLQSLPIAGKPATHPSPAGLLEAVVDEVVKESVAKATDPDADEEDVGEAHGVMDGAREVLKRFRAAYDAAKGGETDDARDARKYREACERAKDQEQVARAAALADAVAPERVHECTGVGTMYRRTSTAAVRHVLGLALDTPPSEEAQALWLRVSDVREALDAEYVSPDSEPHRAVNLALNSVKRALGLDTPPAGPGGDDREDCPACDGEGHAPSDEQGSLPKCAECEGVGKVSSGPGGGERHDPPEYDSTGARESWCKDAPTPTPEMEGFLQSELERLGIQVDAPTVSFDAPEGFAGQAVRVLGDATDGTGHTHRVRLLLCRFTDGSEVPYLEASEEGGPHAGRRLLALSTAVHALRNLGELEVFAVGNRQPPVTLEDRHPSVTPRGPALANHSTTSKGSAALEAATTQAGAELPSFPLQCLRIADQANRRHALSLHLNGVPLRLMGNADDKVSRRLLTYLFSCEAVCITVVREGELAAGLGRPAVVEPAPRAEEGSR